MFLFSLHKEKKKRNISEHRLQNDFFFLLALSNINNTTHQQVLSHGSIRKTSLCTSPLTLLRSRGSKSIFLFSVHQHFTEHQAGPCGCSQMTKDWTSQHHVPKLSSGLLLIPPYPSPPFLVHSHQPVGHGLHKTRIAGKPQEATVKFSLHYLIQNGLWPRNVHLSL